MEREISDPGTTKHDNGWQNQHEIDHYRSGLSDRRQVPFEQCCHHGRLYLRRELFVAKHGKLSLQHVNLRALCTIAFLTPNLSPIFFIMQIISAGCKLGPRVSLTDCQAGPWMELKPGTKEKGETFMASDVDDGYSL